MKNTDNSQFLLVEELEKSVSQEIILLKCLNVMYTCALDFFDKESYDEFLEKLEQQQIIENSLDGVEFQITDLAAKYNDKNVINALLNGSIEVSTCPLCLKKLAEDVLVTHKLLKNCKALNEKLTYRTKDVQDEMKQKMVSSKNRKLIKAGYGSYNQSKVGLIIDC